MPKPLKISGQRFNRLEVIRRVENSKRGVSQWLCKCDCGNTVVVIGFRLTSGHTQSCGCYQRQRAKEAKTIHGYSGRNKETREYRAWKDAKTRCFWKKHIHFKDYGGRGITMNKKWASNFIKFFEYMGECPENYTLERIDVNGNYEPGNCKWASIQEQAWNKKNTRYVDFYHIKIPIAKLVKILKIDYGKLHRWIVKEKTSMDVILKRLNLSKNHVFKLIENF